MKIKINTNWDAAVTLTENGADMYNDFNKRHGIPDDIKKYGDIITKPAWMLFRIFGNDSTHPGMSPFADATITLEAGQDPPADRFDPIGWWLSEAADLRSRKHEKRALYDRFKQLQKIVGVIGNYLGYGFVWGDQRDPEKLIKQPGSKPVYK